MSGRKYASLADAFNAVVVRLGEDECWPANNIPLTELKYGYVSFEGKKYQAHRVSHELHIGPVPEGLLVLHHCDNRPCCNPKHLHAGTHQDNILEAIERDRWKPKPRADRCVNGHARTEFRKPCVECQTAYNAKYKIENREKIRESGRSRKRKMRLGVPTKRIPKTHCPKGHEYTPENTRVSKLGVNQCRVCDRQRKAREWLAR